LGFAAGADPTAWESLQRSPDIVAEFRVRKERGKWAKKGIYKGK